jgi:CDP-diglyceride synthetase
MGKKLLLWLRFALAVGVLVAALLLGFLYGFLSSTARLFVAMLAFQLCAFFAWGFLPLGLWTTFLLAAGTNVCHVAISFIGDKLFGREEDAE